MRIVLVHGINNQGSTSEQIARDWIAPLAEAVDDVSFAKIRRAEIVAPYYGDILDAWASGAKSNAAPVAQAIESPGSDEAEFYRRALEEMAPAAGISEADLSVAAASSQPVEQGFPHDRRLLALVRAFETVSPWKGSVALRVLPQAFAYLKRQTVADDVDAIVRPYLEQGPAIVVAHSLGTVVTFKLLRSQSVPEIPLYLTLGSPLAVRAVKDAVGPKFGRTMQVRRWVNALDIDDAVTIGRPLLPSTFGEGVENISDVDNGEENPHSVLRYLRNRAVARALVSAM